MGIYFDNVTIEPSMESATEFICFGGGFKNSWAENKQLRLR